MVRPESRFCVDIFNFLLDKMLFGHAEQSELKLIGQSYTDKSINRTEDLLVALQRALL